MEILPRLPAQSAGVLAWCQPDEAGHVAARGEARGVAAGGVEGGSGEQADPRQRAQTGNDGDLPGEGLELCLDVFMRVESEAISSHKAARLGLRASGKPRW